MSTSILLFLVLINLKEYRNMLLKGTRVREGQFPWLIQFQTIAPCGGVLLSPDWALTAAQCVQDRRSSIILFAAGLNGTGSKQAVPVKATFIHPQHQAYSILPDRDHNIALLKLTEPFDTCNSKIIFPDIVPIKYDNEYKSCLIFGWQSYMTPSSKVLAKPIQYSEVIVNSWKLCTYMIKPTANFTNVFCTMVEFKDETKACAGNPGSPVVCENGYHKIALVGIASWTNYSLECGNLPSYLNLDVFRTWMHEVVFNDDKNRKWVTDSYDKRNRSWIGTDLLQTNYWAEDTKIQLQNVSGTFHEEAAAENVSKEHNNSAYGYEKIGEIYISKYEDQFQIMNEQVDDFNISLLCENKKFDVISADQIESDDFEFLLPLNIEKSGSDSNFHISHSKNLHLFYVTFWYCYIIIYT